MIDIRLLIAVLAAFLAFFFLKRSQEVAIAFVVPAPVEADPSWKGKYVDVADIRDKNDAHSIICYDPATGYSLGKQRANNAGQVKAIVEKARSAQRVFSKTTFETRRAILNTLLNFVVKNKETICRVSARDSGKAIIDANFGEIIPTCEKLLWTIQNGEDALKTEYRASGRISFLQAARLEYHAIGVMGAIVSWNYPFHNVMGPIISALFAGNAIVVKVSEHVAWSTNYLQSVIDGALKAHGVSCDLVQLVNGFADAGEALIEYADKVIFIGSPNVGKLVMKAASDYLTPVVLELGGKDAAIVFDDCDYANVLDFCSRASIQNAGQNCAGLERMIVHEKIYERLIDDMGRILGNIRVGAPLEGLIDLGAVTMKAQIPKIQELVNDAVAKGARLVCGGKQYIHPVHTMAQYFSPTVLADVTKDMRIAKEEIFGPVITIYKFKTENEALDIANCTEFGLSSSVFSTDYVKAERISKQLKVGMCNINGWGVNYLCQSLPFGGIKLSGFDRFAGIEGLRGNCITRNLRSATTDRLGFLGIRTTVPPLLKYPMSQDSQGFQCALLDMLYAGSIQTKIRAVFQLAVYSMKKSTNT